MDYYIITKYLHVAIAIFWLGGGFSMILLGTLAARRSDTASLMTVVRHTDILARIIFMPASLLLLVLGVYMVWLQWSFVEAWVILGIAGVVMTGFIGGAILTPLVKKITAMEDGPERDALAVKFLRSARADLVMLFVIVWDMVSRPAWSDWQELVIMIAVIVVGGLIFLRK